MTQEMPLACPETVRLLQNQAMLALSLCFEGIRQRTLGYDVIEGTKLPLGNVSAVTKHGIVFKQDWERICTTRSEKS
jgi:hypothetical protein